MDGLVVAHNLFWLRGSGKFTLHGEQCFFFLIFDKKNQILFADVDLVYVCLGLSVAYLSGKESLSDGGQFGKYSEDDVDALRALADDSGVVDLFLTYPFFLNLELLMDWFLLCSCLLVIVGP